MENETGGLFRLFNEKERELLREQKDILDRSKLLTQQIGLGELTRSSHTSVLQDAASFSVVLAGEFNAGKTTVINALLGEKFLETGALPTTESITLLTSEPLPQTQGLLQYTHPLPLLRDLAIIDTPGTNAVIQNHTSQTLKLLPNADLILFCTSADRPFPESERTLLESIAMYRKNIVLLVTKIDILDQTGGDHGDREKARVLDFCREHASSYLGANPMLLAISARDALHYKLMRKTGSQNDSNSKLWKRSNFAALEDFLLSSLTTDSKIQAKLTSPLGLIDGWMLQCREHLLKQQRHLQSDISTMNLLNSQMDSWRKEFVARLDEVKRDMTEPVERQSTRAQLLIRRSSVFTLYQYAFDRKGLEQEWERTKNLALASSTGLSEHLLDIGLYSAESVATFGRAQGQAVIEFLGRQPAGHNQSLVGGVTAASRFEETRQSVAHQLSASIQRHIPKDEKEEEQLLTSIQRLYQLSVALNVSAVVGAFSTYMIDTSLVSVTLGASAMSVAAITVGGSRIADDYFARWQRRKEDLEEDLQGVSRNETERLDRRIQNTVGPYSRFIESEEDRITTKLDECDELLSSSRSLRRRIQELIRSN